MSEEEQVLRFSNDHVEFYLPIDWKESRRATQKEPAVFHSGDKSYQLTMSYQFYNVANSKDHVEEMFIDYFDARVETEAANLSETGELQYGEVFSEEDAFWRTFAGVDQAKNRRFNGLVAAENGKLFAFYLESTSQSAERHNQLLMEVFGSIQIK